MAVTLCGSSEAERGNISYQVENRARSRSTQTASSRAKRVARERSAYFLARATVSVSRAR